MIPRGSQPRDSTPPTLIAVHTSEGARTAASLVAFLDEPGVEASYHQIVDDTTVVVYLPDEVACWAMLSGNNRALQLCFTAFAAWPRSEWLEHDTMLRRGAAVVAQWCQRHSIPPVKLTPGQVGADQSGICGHWDWTLGKRDGTHTDPGPNFPWDVFISYVTGALTIPAGRRRRLVTYHLDPTPLPAGAALTDVPDGTWPTVEDTFTTPGPAGGWPGRVAMWSTFGFGGGYIQEAWSGPSGTHHVPRYDPAKKTGGTYIPRFTPQRWELPPGDVFLVMRYATRARGSVCPESQH